jgi:hypothetical protein
VALLSFEPSLFFFALLPPVILEAGYTLKRSPFFRNLPAILLFAVPGTLLGALGTGLTVYGLRDLCGVPTLTLLQVSSFPLLSSPLFFSLLLSSSLLSSPPLSTLPLP